MNYLFVLYSHSCARRHLHTYTHTHNMFVSFSLLGIAHHLWHSLRITVAADQNCHNIFLQFYRIYGIYLILKWHKLYSAILIQIQSYLIITDIQWKKNQGQHIRVWIKIKNMLSRKSFTVMINWNGRELHSLNYYSGHV